jgi:hypothetical protein
MLALHALTESSGDTKQGRDWPACERAQPVGQQIRSEVVHAGKSIELRSPWSHMRCGAVEEEADTGDRDSGEEASKTRPSGPGPSQVASAVRGSRAITSRVRRAVPLPRRCSVSFGLFTHADTGGTVTPSELQLKINSFF